MTSPDWSAEQKHQRIGKRVYYLHHRPSGISVGWMVAWIVFRVRNVRRPPVLYVIAIGGFVFIGLLCAAVGYRLWRVPDWYIMQGVASGHSVPDLISSYRSAHTPILTALLQALGGAFLLITAVIGFRQLALSREAQLTDRFGRAVEQLGHSNGAVRVGAIHTLERIATEAPAESTSVYDLLAAFLRQTCEYRATDPAPGRRHLPGDAAAALRVLARRRGRSIQPDLSGVDFRGATLDRTDFGGMKLEDAHFEDARLDSADFSGTLLFNARFQDATAYNAKFHNANLSGARFDRAVLNMAEFRYSFAIGTVFDYAQLPSTDFWGAYLRQASFRGADLRSAQLAAAKLDLTHFEGTDLSRIADRPLGFAGCYTDEHTVLPEGYPRPPNPPL